MAKTKASAQIAFDQFLASYGAKYPKATECLVKDRFDAFLECGILAHGFLRLRCPQCGGSLKIIAAIEDSPVIAKILAHLNLPARAPPRSPARALTLFQAA